MKCKFIPSDFPSSMMDEEYCYPLIDDDGRKPDAVKMSETGVSIGEKLFHGNRYDALNPLSSTFPYISRFPLSMVLSMVLGALQALFSTPHKSDSATGPANRKVGRDTLTAPDYVHIDPMWMHVVKKTTGRSSVVERRNHDEIMKKGGISASDAFVTFQQANSITINRVLMDMSASRVIYTNLVKSFEECMYWRYVEFRPKLGYDDVESFSRVVSNVEDGKPTTHGFGFRRVSTSSIRKSIEPAIRNGTCSTLCPKGMIMTPFEAEASPATIGSNSDCFQRIDDSMRTLSVEAFVETVTRMLPASLHTRVESFFKELVQRKYGLRFMSVVARIIRKFQKSDIVIDEEHLNEKVPYQDRMKSIEDIMQEVVRRLTVVLFTFYGSLQAMTIDDVRRIIGDKRFDRLSSDMGFKALSSLMSYSDTPLIPRRCVCVKMDMYRSIVGAFRTLGKRGVHMPVTSSSCVVRLKLMKNPDDPKHAHAYVTPAHRLPGIAVLPPFMSIFKRDVTSSSPFLVYPSDASSWGVEEKQKGGKSQRGGELSVNTWKFCKQLEMLHGDRIRFVSVRAGTLTSTPGAIDAYVNLVRSACTSMGTIVYQLKVMKHHMVEWSKRNERDRDRAGSPFGSRSNADVIEETLSEVRVAYERTCNLFVSLQNFVQGGEFFKKEWDDVSPQDQDYKIPSATLSAIIKCVAMNDGRNLNNCTNLNDSCRSSPFMSLRRTYTNIMNNYSKWVRSVLDSSSTEMRDSDMLEATFPSPTTARYLRFDVIEKLEFLLKTTDRRRPERGLICIDDAGTPPVRLAGGTRSLYPNDDFNPDTGRYNSWSSVTFEEACAFMGVKQPDFMKAYLRKHGKEWDTQAVGYILCYRMPSIPSIFVPLDDIPTDTPTSDLVASVFNEHVHPALADLFLHRSGESIVPCSGILPVHDDDRVLATTHILNMVTSPHLRVCDCYIRLAMSSDSMLARQVALGLMPFGLFSCADAGPLSVFVKEDIELTSMGLERALFHADVVTSVAFRTFA